MRITKVEMCREAQYIGRKAFSPHYPYLVPNGTKSADFDVNDNILMGMLSSV
jgi:hypothetical protein